MSSLILVENLDGAKVSAVEAAATRRNELLNQAALVTTVTDRLDADDATQVLRNLKAFSGEIKAQHAAAKAPVLDIGRRIDALAKDLVAQVNAETDRIAKAVGAFEAEEQRKADEARRKAEYEAARVAAEAQRKADEARRSAPNAEAADRAADAITEKAMEKVVALQQQATQAITVKPADSQLRGTICFEVLDIKALYAAEPTLVTLEPNGTAIRAVIKANPNIQLPGLRHWKEMKLNVR